MKLAACVIVAGIFVNTVKALKSKQVNLALETVLDFDKKDHKADLEVIDKVQNFLQQIKNGMQRNSRRSGSHLPSFTDFVLKASKILKRYDDNKLEEAFVIVNDESRKHINKESTFNDLFDQDMRRYVTGHLDDAKEMSADSLRKNLGVVIHIIEEVKKSGKRNDFLDVGNSLYDAAGEKLNRALKNLNHLRRSNKVKLEQVLKETLRSLIFDHYASLDTKVREELINMVKHYWRAFASNDQNGHVGVKRSKTKFATLLRHETSKHGHQHESSPNVVKVHYSKSPEDNSESSRTIEIDIKEHSSEKRQAHERNADKKSISEQNSSEKKIQQNRFNIYSDKNNYRTPEVKDPSQKLRSLKSPPLSSSEKAKKREGKQYKKSQELESDARKPRVVMGGQTLRETYFRGEESSKEVSDDLDRQEGETSTEEIVIQHSNIIDIGLSKKAPGRLNITFGSSEFHQGKKGSGGETPKLLSVIRKSNTNETLAPVTKIEDVNILLKNIEDQIAQVKDQVEYIRNLAKNNLNNKSRANSTAKDETGSADSKSSGFAFRAEEDSDIYNYSVELNQNDTTKQTNKSHYKSFTTNGDVTSNRTAKVENNTSINIRFKIKTNSDQTKDREFNDRNPAPDDNTANNQKEVIDKSINKTSEIKENENDQENAITESNLNSTDTVATDKIND